MKWRTSRRVIQLAALGLLLLPIVWPRHNIWVGSYLSSQFFNIALTDPLAALEVMLAGKIIWAPLLWSLIPLLIVGMILGRVFCSWICPLNTLFEWLSDIRKPEKRGGKNNLQPYWLLAWLLPMALITGLPLFTMISPIGIVMRGLVFGVGLEIVLLVGLVALELFYDKKFWCRRCCPVGALYGLLGRWRALKIKVDAMQCTSCGSCRKSCTMGVNPGSEGITDTLFCTNCGDCIDVCAAKTVGYTWDWKGGGKHNEYMENNKK